MENKINQEVPEEVITEVKAKIAEIKASLKPYLIALSPQERKNLPKMGDGTEPFVSKSIEYSSSAPQFAPPFLNVDGFKIDMKVWEQLMSVYRPLAQLTQDLDDTVMEAGAESYTSALSYYNSVKFAARMSVPESKTIYEDLRARFVKNGNRN